MADVIPYSHHPAFQESIDKPLLREFSIKADEHVQSSIGASVSPTMGVIFVLNSVTGLSLLTLPFGFQQAGLVLGSLILVGCVGLSFVTMTFMTEALTIANAMTYEQAERETLQKHVQDGSNVLSRLHQEKADLLKAKPQLQSRNTLELFFEEVMRENPAREFKIRERVEVGAMGERVVHNRRGKVLSYGIYVVVLAFTIGTAIALTVTVNSSLSHTICHGVEILGLPPLDPNKVYPFCVVGQFLLTLPLCFTDLQKTKQFTTYIMYLRFTAIGLMVLASSVHVYGRISAEGSTEVLRGIPLWNMNGFVPVFSNAVFLAGLHHYLPSMISPLQPQRQANCVLGTALSLCVVLIFLVCATALVAWGHEPDATCSLVPGGDFCQIQPLYNLNFSPLSWGGGTVGLFLLGYPALAIAAIPIAAITTRNNLAKVLNIPQPSGSNPYTLSNVLLTLGVLAPPSAVALLTQDVQTVIKYVGGYGGLTLSLLCPVVLLIKFRRELHLDKMDAIERPLKSPFAHPVSYALVLLCYVGALVVVTQKLFFS